MTNVTNEASSFNGRSQEIQITDAGDTGEEGLLEMVCIYDEGPKRQRLARTLDRGQ